ncbi:hypothetical protein H1P_3770002 [Hyella patelloides LEGE 07179]|uniref:Uncharacterized protein n=1 Tax=Hyella patelloides LEGE 07179 TaxID=945734 RepID=A0A563VWS2_9CYAN|nr:hypothetical protein H1P_3770002 [Hyella patelloides LEGE 07179]
MSVNLLIKIYLGLMIVERKSQNKEQNSIFIKKLQIMYIP